MTCRAYRITQGKYAKTAFDGEGARLYGGRWNSVGTPLVYVASSISLATLELLVHLEDYSILEDRYVVIPITFPDRLVEELPLESLPSGWNRPSLDTPAQALGDRWISEARSVALRVPSAVTPGEHNYLLNPQHPDFAKLTIGDATPFALDPRLSE